MTENGYAPTLSPNPENESSEHTTMRFATLSGCSSIMGGTSRGYMITHGNNCSKMVPAPPPPAAQPSFGGEYCVLPRKSNEDLTPPSSKKPRGRPPGSKNKPKPPILIREDSDNLLKLILIEIPFGNDIVETLLNLARRRQAGITVLSGSGLVSDVTLCHPFSHAPAFPIQGPFNMISLSGSYVNANCGRVPPQFFTNPCCSSFSIYLSGGRGQVFGGVVGGKVMSAGNVVITATLFKKSEFHMALVNDNIEEVELDDPRYAAGGVIINVDRRVADEPNNNNNNNTCNINNNTVLVSGFGVVAGGNSASLNRQLPPPPPPADVNVMQWNHSIHTDHY